VDLNYTYVDVGGYINSNALEQLKELIVNYGFTQIESEFGIKYELTSKMDHDLIFGLYIFIAPNHPEDAFDVSLSGYDVMSIFEFNFLVILKDYIIANRWNPELTNWRFHVGRTTECGIRVARSNYNRCLRVLYESEWILSNQEFAINGIKTLKELARDKLSEDRIANRPAELDNVKLLYFQGALLYQQEVMLFGTFDGFCHQLYIAILRDRDSLSYPKAMDRARSKTFSQIENIESTLQPIDINFSNSKSAINNVLKRLYEQRNKKVHRGARSYGDNIETIEKDYTLICSVIRDIQKSFSTQFTFSNRVL
jgi:hypothetical protein